MHQQILRWYDSAYDNACDCLLALGSAGILPPPEAKLAEA
jgi:hypothetical protein